MSLENAMINLYEIRIHIFRASAKIVETCRGATYVPLSSLNKVIGRKRTRNNKCPLVNR